MWTASAQHQLRQTSPAVSLHLSENCILGLSLTCSDQCKDCQDRLGAGRQLSQQRPSTKHLSTGTSQEALQQSDHNTTSDYLGELRCTCKHARLLKQPCILQ
jgi:hypothetical protein